MRPRKEIWEYKCEDGDCFWDYADEWDTPEIDKSPVIDLEGIVDFADRQAEARNNHAFVGTHRILAALLHKKLGRQQATEIMREIAEYGGLDGMSGCGGEADAFGDFGIEDCWKDWKLDNAVQGESNE